MTLHLRIPDNETAGINLFAACFAGFVAVWCFFMCGSLAREGLAVPAIGEFLFGTLLIVLAGINLKIWARA